MTAETTRITEREFVASGGARLAHRDIVLYADTITYDIPSAVAIARGNVLLLQGPRRLVAEEVTYRYSDHTFTVSNFRVGQGEIMAEAARASGDAAGLKVEEAQIFFSEPEPLAPTLRADTLTYTDAADGRPAVMELQGATFGVGQVHFLPLPRLRETPEKPTFASVSVDAGHDSRLGAQLSVEATTALSDQVRLGGDLGIFTRRGLLLGPIGNYDTFESDGLGARGELRTGYIKDQGPTGLDLWGDPIQSHRGFIEWKHYQVVAPGMEISGNLNYWSDSFVTRDFRPDRFNQNQAPDTWFEAAKLTDNFIVSIFTRVQVNDFAVVQERLPEVRFDGLPVEIGAGIYHRLNASVTALREDTPLDASETFQPLGTTRSNRADLYYSLSRPFSPREWLAVTPVIGARVTHYERLRAGSPRGGDFTRVIGEFGFDSKLYETSATWNTRSERWGIDGLRHIVTPRVSYRLSPSADVGRGDIPAIDRDVSGTHLRPLGLGDRRDTDTLPELNTFRFQVDNVLQTRDPAYGSRNLVSLALAADQYASPDAAASAGQSRDRSDAHALLTITPATWLGFELYNRTTIQTGETQEFDASLVLRDADVWTLRLGADFLNDPVAVRELREFHANLDLRLSEIYSAYFRLRYDSRAGEFTEQTYGLTQRLTRAWTIGYALSLYNGPRREGDIGVSVSVENDAF